MKLFLICFFAIFHLSFSHAIVGGDIVENVEAFPGILDLGACGGVKISADMLLTAAHCVGYTANSGAINHSSLRNMTVYYGANEGEQINIQIYVLNIFLPPSAFSKNLNFYPADLDVTSDIAILQIQENELFDETIPTARLYDGPSELIYQVFLAGYGYELDGHMTSIEKTEYETDESPYKNNRLKAVKTTVDRIIDRYFIVNSYTQEGDSSRANKKDSGSPFYTLCENGEKCLIGIASSISREKTIFSNYARIENRFFGNWVAKTIQGETAPIPWNESTEQ